MHASIPQLVWAAIRHPHCALRHLAGRPASGIDLSEIARYLPREPTIVEAGAADGLDTAAFATRFPLGRVVALEPVPHLYREACLRTAQFENVSLVQAALTPQDLETVEMHVDDVLGHSSSILAPGSHLDVFPEISFSQRISVRGLSLDRVVEDFNLQSVDLLWLDLQGLELAVLAQGGSAALARTKLVHLEVSRKPLYIGAPDMRAVVKFMAAHGFRPLIARVPIAMGNILFGRKST